MRSGARIEGSELEPLPGKGKGEGAYFRIENVDRHIRRIESKECVCVM